MAAFSSIALAVGAAATVGGTYISYKNQKKAAASQRRQQEVATRRSRRQAIRQAQIARAQSVATAASSGARGSSAAQGGQASIGSQTGEALGFSTQMSGLSADISRFSSRANTGAAIAQLGQLGISYGSSNGGSFDWLKRPQTKPNSVQQVYNFGSNLYGASAGPQGTF